MRTCIHIAGGVDVGTLPNLQHGVGGTLEIISATSMRIRDFRYDGQGPGMYLCMQYDNGEFGDIAPQCPAFS